jgi:predicted CoA-binding protein
MTSRYPTRSTTKETSMATTLRQIDTFLALKRIAVVGVSRDPKQLSYTLWQELRQRRYDVVAVNPATAEIDGKPCYPSVRDIDPPVDGALIMTTAGVAERVLEDCAAAGIGHVWLYGGLGGGATSPATIAAAERLGLDAVAGHCPYMFLPGTPVFHGIHGFGKKLTGSYPKAG